MIRRHARCCQDIQFRAERRKNVGLEDAFDHYNPGIGQKIGEPEFEMERAARSGSLRQVRGREPEVTQALSPRERQWHLAGLNPHTLISHGYEQPGKLEVFLFPEVNASVMFPEAGNTL